MQTILAVLILIFCFAAIAVGLLIARKTLRKGCSDEPGGCACKREGKNPADCSDQP